MSLMDLQTEPTHDRPCWVLTYKSYAKRGMILTLREYKWAGESWRPVADSLVEHPRSLYAALEKADWLGRLPHQGRKRRAFTPDNLARVTALKDQGRTRKEIEAETGLSHPVVHKLWHYKVQG